MKSFFRKYQIIIFFVLTFTVSWSLWYTGGYGFKVAGPSFAGLIVVAIVGGWKGIVEMLRRLVRWQVGFLWWSVALLDPPTMVLLPIGIHIIQGYRITIIELSSIAAICSGSSPRLERKRFDDPTVGTALQDQHLHT